jgi:hypothetical protein
LAAGWKNVMKILLVAEPFGFGPVGSLMSCRKQLSHENYTWRYAGAHFTGSVITGEEFDDVLLMQDNFDITDSRLCRFIDWADIIISGTEFRLNKVLKDPDKKLIIYDPLFWFWPFPPKICFPNTFYICQNFINLDRKKIPGQYKNRFFIVNPPIYKKKTNKTLPWFSKLIIHLCGLVNPVCILDGYYEFVLDSIVDIKSDILWKDIAITGNKLILQELAGSYSSKLNLTCMNHSGMIRAVESCNLFVTSPGLNSSLEAMSLDIPAAFLPPQNNSQAAQLDVFQNYNLSPLSMDWHSITNHRWNWQNTKPAEAIQELKNALHYCKSHPGCSGKFKDNLSTLLNMNEREWWNIQKKQKAFFESLMCNNSGDFKDAFTKIISF